MFNVVRLDIQPLSWYDAGSLMAGVAAEERDPPQRSNSVVDLPLVPRRVTIYYSRPGLARQVRVDPKQTSLIVCAELLPILYIP